MRRQKEHQEFSIVRDWVRGALAGVCSGVQVEPAKALLKLSAVQHLYGKLAGRMRRGKSDADLLVRPHLLSLCVRATAYPAWGGLRRHVLDTGSAERWARVHRLGAEGPTYKPIRSLYCTYARRPHSVTRLAPLSRA